MPDYITVTKIAELKPGERTVVEIDEHYIAVFNVGGTYYAVEDLCPHDDGPLAEGELDGAIIECPRHGARFDLKTGAVLSLPAIKPVPHYEVRVEGDEVQILI